MFPVTFSFYSRGPTALCFNLASSQATRYCLDSRLPPSKTQVWTGGGSKVPFLAKNTLSPVQLPVGCIPRPWAGNPSLQRQNGQICAWKRAFPCVSSLERQKTRFPLLYSPLKPRFGAGKRVLEPNLAGNQLSEPNRLEISFPSQI